jgi:hypothetical protein
VTERKRWRSTDLKPVRDGADKKAAKEGSGDDDEAQRDLDLEDEDEDGEELSA